MKTFLLAYAGAALAFLLGDMLWLSGPMARHYQAWIGPLLLPQPRLVPAALFYLSYVLGIVVFGVLPGLRDGGWRRSAGLSALFGLLAYGTYDLSNLATLRDWPVQLALVDMAWGTGLSCCAGCTGFAFARTWGRAARAR